MSTYHRQSRSLTIPEFLMLGDHHQFTVYCEQCQKTLTEYPDNDIWAAVDNYLRRRYTPEALARLQTFGQNPAEYDNFAIQTFINLDFYHTLYTEEEAAVRRHEDDIVLPTLENIQYTAVSIGNLTYANRNWDAYTLLSGRNTNVHLQKHLVISAMANDLHLMERIINVSREYADALRAIGAHVSDPENHEEFMLTPVHRDELTANRPRHIRRTLDEVDAPPQPLWNLEPPTFGDHIFNTIPVVDDAQLTALRQTQRQAAMTAERARVRDQMVEMLANGNAGIGIPDGGALPTAHIAPATMGMGQPITGRMTTRAPNIANTARATFVADDAFVDDMARELTRTDAEVAGVAPDAAAEEQPF